jgi:hypothetical protein
MCAYNTAVDGFYSTTCVLSVEKKDNGGYGEIRDAMRVADEYMYKDKDKYYTEHPDRKYR